MRRYRGAVDRVGQPGQQQQCESAPTPSAAPAAPAGSGSDPCALLTGAMQQACESDPPSADPDPIGSPERADRLAPEPAATPAAVGHARRRAHRRLARAFVAAAAERALRAGVGLADAFDNMSRLGRARGEIPIMVTHSLADLEALPTPEGTPGRGAGLLGVAGEAWGRLAGAASHGPAPFAQSARSCPCPPSCWPARCSAWPAAPWSW